MNRTKLLPVILLINGLLLFISPLAWSDEPSRGQQLYENHCTGCHESNAHIRAKRKAQSIADVQTQIVRWRNHLELPWRAEDIEDVLNFLNSEYYHYPPAPQ